MGQLFDTVDRLRLEVAHDWPGPPNLIANHSGGLGISGWRRNDIVIGPPLPSPLESVTLFDGEPALEFTREDTGAQSIISDLVVFSVTPEQAADSNWPGAAARVTGAGGTGTFRYRIHWYNYDDRSEVDVSDWSDPVVDFVGAGVLLIADYPVDGLIIWIAPPETPRGYVALEIEILGDVDDPGAVVQMRDITLVVGDVADLAAAEVDGTVVAHPGWVDILGPSLSVKIDRAPLNACTLVARVRDSTLDPAQVPLLRKGKTVRAMAQRAEGFFEPIFTGTVSQAEVTYDLAALPAPVADINLTAVDPDAAMAIADRAEVSNALADLPWMLAGTGIPVTVDGSSILPDLVTGSVAGDVVTIAGAKLLDQLVLVRDTTQSLIWVDRWGFVQATDDPDDTIATYMDENFYNAAGPALGYNTEDCINEVTFTVVSDDGAGGAVETKYGPYSDQASVAINGRHPIEFRVLGPDTDWSDSGEAALRAYAGALFVTNGYPQRRITAVTAVIIDSSDFSLSQKVFRDLYDRVQVSNVLAGIDEPSRIVALTHDITPARWSITYSLVEDVARPLPTTPTRI